MTGFSTFRALPVFCRILTICAVLLLVSIGCGAPESEGSPPSAGEPPEAASPTRSEFPAPGGAEGEGETPGEIPGEFPSGETPDPVEAQIPEQRLLTLEWPATLRQGDADTVRLSLEVDEEGQLTPSAEIEGHEVKGQPVEIPNLYDTHNVIAEARLDLAGMQIVPGPEVSEPLRPGQKVSFYWSVRAEDVGKYRGTLWLHLNFIPRGEGEESRIAVTAQQLEIQVVNLFGLGGTPARLLGGAGALIGSMLGLDNVAGWVWGVVRRKRETS